MNTIHNAFSRAAKTGLIAVSVWCAAQYFPGAQAAAPADEGSSDTTTSQEGSSNLGRRMSATRSDKSAVVTSPGMAEVVKLIQAQVDESIIISYVENSKTVYQPTVEEILYLKELGASAKLTTALLSKGQKPATPKAETPQSQVDTNRASVTVPANQLPGQTAADQSAITVNPQNTTMVDSML